MKELKSLNCRTAPKSVMPERIIQFGEGNFLRAFVDWIVFNMNQKTDFNSSVVVVQPLEHGMIDRLNGQDCLYHVNLQGKEDGKPVDTSRRLTCPTRLASSAAHSIRIHNSKPLWHYQSNLTCVLLFQIPPKQVLPLMRLVNLQIVPHQAIQVDWFSFYSIVINILMVPMTKE